MKTFLLVLFLIVVLATVGLAFFIYSFDLDRYRPLVTEKLQEALGRPVQMDRVSLGWHGGLAAELRGLTIGSGAETPRELVKLRSASAVVRLGPLLHKEIEVSSVILDQPSIYIVRGPSGEIRGFETRRKSPYGSMKEGVQAPPSGPAGSPKNVGALPFLVEYVKIQNGEVFFRDEARRVPVETTARNIDVTLRNVSLNETIQVEARAALFGRNQNVRVLGDLRISPEDHTGSLDHVHAEADLSSLDMNELSRLVPDLSAAGLGVKGNFSADIDSLKLDSTGLKNLAAQIHLKNAGVQVSSLRKPIENINFDAKADSSRFEIQNLSAELANGSVQATGNVNLATEQPLHALKVSLNNLSLQELMPEAGNDEPQLRGKLSGSFEGTARGTSAPLIANTLSGQGQVVLVEGVVLNFNLLREVFNRLGMIPGLTEKLDARLPVEYRQKLEAQDTVFNPIQLPLVIRNGTLSFDNIAVRTDSLDLQGVGSIGMGDKRVALQMRLKIDPDLSAALIQSVRELQYLADQEGRLEIPLIIQGFAPHITVVPDLQFVASKLAMSKGQEMLGNLFQNKTPGVATDPNMPVDPYQQGQQVPQPTQKPLSKMNGRELLGQFLQTAMQPQGSQNTQTSDTSVQQQQS